MKGRAPGSVAASVCALVLAACSSSGFIDRVTVDNATAYPANVGVTSSDRDGWLLLGLVDANSVMTVEHVVDQGDLWIFRFDYLGKHEVEIRVSRQELERSKWRVEVPENFEQALQEMGIRPPP